MEGLGNKMRNDLKESDLKDLDLIVIPDRDRILQRHTYGGHDFTIPHVSDVGYYMYARPLSLKIDQDNVIIKDLNSIWDQRKFSISERYPLHVGSVENRFLFTQPMVPRTLDMPIKFPGTEYRVPQEFSQFEETIKTCIDFEHFINNQINDYYAYLTVDQLPVKVGSMQRNEGCHVDGFQGARINPKVKIDHSYIVTDVLPTIFYPHPFETSHLDESVHNFFLDFDRQADQTRAIKLQPFEIFVIDAYTVHRGDYAEESTNRTFFRLSYSVREFDRLGNTHNPMFEYKWQMVPRETQSSLKKYTEILQ